MFAGADTDDGGDLDDNLGAGRGDDDDHDEEDPLRRGPHGALPGGLRPAGELWGPPRALPQNVFKTFPSQNLQAQNLQTTCFLHIFGKVKQK